MRDAVVKALCERAADDPSFVLITGDLGFKVLDEFRTRFPAQFINAGVAEQNMAGVACGMALEGKTVALYSIGNFVALRCLEQLRNGAAYHELNVNAISVGAGFTYGALGMSHHATEDMAILRALPGVDVLCPGDDSEAIQVTAEMLRRPRMSYLRLETAPALHTEPSLAHPDVERSPFSFGKARLLLQGDDVTLVTIGGIVGEVLAAAKLLRGARIQAGVLHYHSLAPFDAPALLAAANATPAVVTVEEHSVDGGLGSVSAECLLESGAHPPLFKRLGITSGFTRVVGSQAYLRKLHGLDAAAIAAQVTALCGKTRRSGLKVAQFR